MFVWPIVNITYHNLYQLHYVFPKYKIAIQYHLKESCLPFSLRATARQKLPSKLMKYDGWKILDMTSDEFTEFDSVDRDAYMRQWITTARDE